ncbi:MAG: hypothetical protein CR986_07735 [Ignavibacteriae bacterium]|nr:MAG: hypothetical protein CR986_07735 [Ignavibacteriota bacterium]
MVKKTILLLFAACILFAQEETKMSLQRYHTLVDSLTLEKDNLIELKKLLKSEIDSLKQLKSELSDKLKSARKTKLIKTYGKEIGNRIYNGQVWKGMTEKMLEESWGRPDKIKQNKEKWGLFRQWYYGKITYFFRDGILTDWEEKK